MSRYDLFSARHALTAWVALVCLLSAPAYAGALKIAVVLSEQRGAYQEYSDALARLLMDKKVTLNVVDADMPVPDADLVIAAGMKASLNVARSKPAAMLVVLAPKEGVGKLLNDFPALQKSATNTFSAIYLDQPLKRQLDLIAAVLPEATSIGILYSEPPKDLGALRMLAAARKLELNERSATSSSMLHATLQTLLLSSDVLLALPDTEIYNASTIRNILLATYRNKIPLIGFSAAYVKAGALCAVFSTPEQIAGHSSKIIQEFIESHTLPAAHYAKDFEVSLNEQVARSLGLNIRSASQVRAEIGAAP